MSCITKLLEIKGNKEALIPYGNWIAVEGGGVYNDYEYLIVLNSNGHRCGYVALPSDHIYSQTPEEKRNFLGGTEYSHWDYDSLDIRCHGGLTFMSPEHSLKDLLDIPCTDMWVGFDCGHSDDACDKEAFRRYFGESLYQEKESFFDAMSCFPILSTVKNFSYVEKECKSIIDQLIERAA